MKVVRALALASTVMVAQNTQSLISGRAVDAGTGTPLGGARVAYHSLATSTSGVVTADRNGLFTCPPLPPGRYRIRATAGDSYQAREVHEMDLPVAGRLDITFSLRPIADVFNAGQYRSYSLPRGRAEVTFFGPDVDTSRTAPVDTLAGSRGALETSLSQAVDPGEVANLPFGGRDLYSILAVQPGVAADAATARGLGLSANGQRPTSTNFLLDGLENNNYTASGPLTVVAPESMQEYRVSTNNFSAEYGRAAGFVANAVTKSGGNSWHGIAYLNLRDTTLNANEFQFNAAGLQRPPLRERQPGGQLGGPVLRERLFVSSSLERTSTTGFSPQPVHSVLPTTLFASLFPLGGASARRLMRDFPPPAVTAARNATAEVTLQRPQNQTRTLALERVDWMPARGRQQLTGRVSISRVHRPDHFWSPYRDFVSGLEQPHQGVALAHQFNLRPGLVSELRVGWSRESLSWERAHPEIPTLASADGVALPGSPASFSYSHRNSNAELAGSLFWARGRHLLKFGGGILPRRLSARIGFGGGQVLFDSFLEFVGDQPYALTIPLQRRSLPVLSELARLDRDYRYTQAHGFLQDTIKVTPRLVVNLGARYESFGSPTSDGAGVDAVLRLGEGANFAERLQGAQLRFGGIDKPYDGPGNWAGRFGWSYALRRDGSTSLRMAVGTFHDRPYDSLWQGVRNNSLTIARLSPDFGDRLDYLAPTRTLLGRFQSQPVDASFPRLNYVDPTLRAGYSQSYLLGLRQELGAMEISVHALGALSRRLLTTDIVNRDFSLRTGAGNFTGRYNPALPEVAYLGNQGSASYHAMSATARWKGRAAQLNASYTWSHSIDNQSEPFDGELLFDPAFTRATAVTGVVRPVATFSRQFDSSGDRGSSDFDQRHNLAVYSIAEFQGWRFAQTAAFRTGFPYSVFSVARVPPPGQGVLYNTRATLVSPPDVREDTGGGARLLARSAFRSPTAGAQGNSGRNAFRAPGLYSVDLSAGRSFPIRRLTESTRITVRADFFNALNHANLGAPANQLESGDFGLARFGRQGSPSFFPALLPFQETGRQVQILLRVEF